LTHPLQLKEEQKRVVVRESESPASLLAGPKPPQDLTTLLQTKGPAPNAFPIFLITAAALIRWSRTKACLHNCNEIKIMTATPVVSRFCKHPLRQVAKNQDFANFFCSFHPGKLS
jgi:hypothetical protein